MRGEATPERRRVLLLADSPYMGGVTSHLVECARALPAHTRFDAVLATLPPKRDDATLYTLAGRYDLPVHEIPMASTYDVRVFGLLRNFVERQEIDLVHCHNYRALLLCRAARLPVPVVSTSHGMKVGAGLRLRLWEALELRAMRRLPAAAACSDFVKGWLTSRGVAPERVRTVRNAVAEPRRCEPADLETMGVAPGQRALLYAGRLVEGKGLADLIDALGNAPGWTALIAGDGPLRPALEAQTAATRAQAAFLGPVCDIGPLLRACRAAALPSAMEALPMTLIEAAACGVPAVATDRGGIPEVVADRETGLLVPYGAPGAISQALERLEDEAFREALGSAARERWARLFTPETMASQLAALYDDALASSR
jgi:glycosyltransferase involved in cell wall biosynthesis